jgi:hypothetical protein
MCTFHQRRMEWSQLEVTKTFSFLCVSLRKREVSLRGNNLHISFFISQKTIAQNSSSVKVNDSITIKFPSKHYNYPNSLLSIYTHKLNSSSHTNIPCIGRVQRNISAHPTIQILALFMFWGKGMERRVK